MNTCRCSLQMFFTVGALKNFLILKTKKETSIQVFSCKKQPLRGLVKKRCSFLPADANILKDFLVLQEQLKMLG